MKIKVELPISSTMFRIPVSEKGCIVHKPKKGKGSYSRRMKHSIRHE